MQPLPSSPLFDSIARWLLSAALRETGVEDLVRGFGERLTGAGIALYRLSVGGLVLHPVFGALDLSWSAADRALSRRMVPRDVIIDDTPFFWAATNQIAYRRFDMTAGPTDPDFPLFQKFREAGVTDYMISFETRGRRDAALWADLPPGMEGIVMAVSTCRIGGFTDYEVAYIRELMPIFALAMKTAVGTLLAHEILAAYLGRHSGSRVLDGVIRRGDGGTIDCVLFHCDLRDSSRLAETLPLDTYLGLINDYFDCTAGAVAAHGGEVLKFIGDAVMAIFPIGPERPAIDMCRAATTAAREAFRRVEQVNARSRAEGAEPIRFGAALHRGEVMYGNVGTAERLDFTTIGPAVNRVARLEGLSKALGTPLVISDAFAAESGEPLVSLGTHGLAGVGQPVEVFTLRDFAAADIGATA